MNKSEKSLHKLWDERRTGVLVSPAAFREYLEIQYDEIGEALIFPHRGESILEHWQAHLDHLWQMARELGKGKEFPPPLPRIESVAEGRSAIDQLAAWTGELERKMSARRIGRPRKNEKDSVTKVIAALSAWHGYENGSVTNPEPATNRGLAEKYELAENALTRFLKERGGDKKYKVACRNGSIGLLLAAWNGELLDRHAELLPHETGLREEE